MRTRFLSSDYFNSAAVQARETLEFLRLPPPHLPPSNPYIFENLRCFFDHVSALSLSLDIETFPIDHALSKFLSDVVPRSIDVETGDFASCSGEGRLEEERSFSPRSNTGVHDLKEKNELFINGKEENGFEVVEFEMPELDLSLENACLIDEEKIQLFAEIGEADKNLDMLDPVLTLHNPSMVLKSIYSVDHITPEYHMEQKDFLLEDAGSAQDQGHLHNCTFPFLEVNEIGLGIFSGIGTEEEFLLLENIELEVCPQREVIVDANELLSSLDIDILELLTDPSFSKQYFNAVASCSNFSLDMELISIIELSHTEGNSTFQPDGNSIWSVCQVNFEEIQFLEFDSYQFLEVLSNCLTVCEAETCEQMFVEDSNFVNFNELVVSHELTLVDESFKSLPIPILPDPEKISSKFLFVEEMLADLKPRHPSMSDDIYLDWHLLEEDYSYCDKYSSCWKQVMEINNDGIDADLEPLNDGILIFDLVSSGDISDGAIVEDNKEILNILPGGISKVSVCLNDLASSKLLNDGCQQHGNGEVISDMDVGRGSTLTESVLSVNDLNFLLNPREATAGRSSKPAVNAFHGNAMFCEVSYTNQNAPCAAPTQLQQWDLKLHQVKLPGNFLELVENFEKNYLAILKSDRDLTDTQHSCLGAYDTKLLSLPKEKLMECIKKTNALGTSLVHGDENTVALVTLCVIKQMAWYLCYYGIHTTYRYVDKLCRALECLKFRLNFLQNLIEDMHWKAERDVTAFHPSIPLIQAILQSNIIDCGAKVLIVAEQVFWWPLKRLLTSMHMSFSEQQSFCSRASQLDLRTSKGFIDTKADVVQHSDCCLISYEHISTSFPFEKFSIILEYGGSCGSSRVSTIAPKQAGFPPLHFLKVELEDSSAAKALCEGVDMPQSAGFTTKLEELLNFVPHEEKCGMGSSRAADQVNAFSMPLPVQRSPSAVEPGKMPANMSSFPDTIIIVNTQNFDKEMIISRRSTYQRILAMEKQGVQVVERDLKLPVDVTISAANCLVWYDCKNIGKKATAPDEASSSLPLCIENIAANVLTSLSFTFSCCILVFEGDSSFLAAVMESLDELYAAAASLGIDLQIFCSFSSELTDEIILSCIGCATKLTRHIYPKMPESESLAESFLTSFPSINPLSSHAILSSGGILVEFLEWSHEHRIRAIKKYEVPDESVSLFSTLCRFGEREDSRSAMTDCSSSVSSAPDSKNCHGMTDSVRKKGKYIGSPPKTDTPTDDLFHFEMLKQFPDGSLHLPSASKPHDTWLSGVEEIFDEIEKPGAFVSEKLFSQKQGSGVDVLRNPSTVCQLLDPQMSRTEISNQMKRPSWPLDDKLFGPEEALDLAPVNKLDHYLNNNSAHLREGLISEVIDIGDSFSAGEDFSTVAKSLDLSCLVPETNKDPPVGSTRTARTLSFSRSSLPTFPTAAEISDDSNSWVSGEDYGQSFREGSNRHTDGDFTKHKLPLKNQEKLLEDNSIQRTMANFPRLSVQEKDTHQHGGTPLSKAVHSAHPQQGSPWTIEFLNRIRERSRSRLQSLPPDISPPCFTYSGNISKITKRKSPSILDFYKYQGGSTPRKIIEQKRQKRSTQPSTSSKNEKVSASFCPSWTPLDKRARRTLSFSMGGSGGQSKLVWSDKDAQNLDRRFYN